MISKERLTYLITICNQQQASAAELEELDQWYASFDKDAGFTGNLSDAEKFRVQQRMLQKINIGIESTTATVLPTKTTYLFNWKYIGIAASMLLVIAAGLTFYNSLLQSKVNGPTVVKHLNDINPGTNKAILTLADGTKIYLNDSKNGVLASQEQSQIVKTADGAIKYQHTEGKDNTTPLAYNTISVPRGGKYQLILPDGSKVWLNSQSSLKYPAVFTGSKRDVELMGEAYFEIAHDQTKPFSVHSAGQIVKVLGTHFNINTYPASVVKTTLLEGSILLSQEATGIAKKLLPGQQASLKGHTIDVTEANTEESLAWKNDLFIFNNTDLPTLILQLERWYDVDITAAKLPNKRFYGRISRDVKLSAVLNMLQVTSNIQFKIEGRRVTMVN
ncbi:FecR family protein [Pedobacter sp. AW31-3R]|uniref:FecR family protein n=1 Tax=Pedobacter sp. AW31-3R TaxID=3445781 RepID=UPI003FA01D49